MLTVDDMRKLADLQRAYADERRKRIELEQGAAGMRSAIVRLQALLARQKAEAAEARAESVG